MLSISESSAREELLIRVLVDYGLTSPHWMLMRSGLLASRTRVRYIFRGLIAVVLSAVIRRSSRSLSENKLGDNFLVLDVRLCNGKLVTIAVNERGFSSCTKHHLREHSLVALLRSLSKAFAKVNQ